MQDPGELGLANVHLTIANSSAPLVIVGNAVTGSDGSYTFGGLAAGTYIVSVTTGLPTGYLASPYHSNFGSASTDSDGNPTATVTVGFGATDNTIDFGFYHPTGVIGDFVNVRSA